MFTLLLWHCSVSGCWTLVKTFQVLWGVSRSLAYFASCAQLWKKKMFGSCCYHWAGFWAHFWPSEYIWLCLIFLWLHAYRLPRLVAVAVFYSMSAILPSSNSTSSVLIIFLLLVTTQLHLSRHPSEVNERIYVLLTLGIQPDIIHKQEIVDSYCMSEPLSTLSNDVVDVVQA